MGVPFFGDLGKTARDLLRTGYTYDLAKFKFRKPLSDLGFECDTYSDLKSFKSGITALSNYKIKNYGKLNAKISSDGPVVLEYNSDGIIFENLDVVAGYSKNIADSFQSCKLATNFHNSLLRMTLSLTNDFDRSVELLSSLVLKSNNLIVGYQAGFNTNTPEIIKNNVAFAFDQGNMILHLQCIQIPREFGLSVFYAVNDDLKVATDIKMASNENMGLWYLAAGFCYKLADDCKMRMKFDKNLQLGTNMLFQLKSSLLVTLAFNLDFTNLKSGQHRIGFGVEMTG